MFKKIQEPYPTPKNRFFIDSNVSQSFLDYKGFWVVLYFYPKDLTPGCTIEAQVFQEFLEEFEKRKTKILGVSRDSLNLHKKFKEKHNLTFSLISDENSELCEAFQVLKEKKMFGKTYLSVSRETFLINPQGLVVGHWAKVTPKSHAQDVLKTLDKIL